MNIKEIYNNALKLCVKDIYDFDTIVNLDEPPFNDKLIKNEKAKNSSLFIYKLDEKQATEQDYKDFIDYIYSYIGMESPLNLGLDTKQEEEDNTKDMADSKKIRALLKKYGASDYEIENFMDELEEEDFNPYSKDVISKLRETPEGKAIIRDMPKTDKNELIKKIKEHLGNND